MLVLINIALGLLFASIYSSIWRRITGMDLSFSVLVEIAVVYIVVSVGLGFLIHFMLLTSVAAGFIASWGVLKTVSLAVSKKYRKG